MTTYYTLEPEVAGGWGKNIKANTSVHPPIVHALHYEFQDWLGDEIVESFPCFLVSERLSIALKDAKLNGFSLAEAEVSVSEEFKELKSASVLPKFRWLKIQGRAGEDDFGLSEDNLLVASKRALEVLRQFPLSNAEIAKWRR
jgi:hypothetical protein